MKITLLLASVAAYVYAGEDCCEEIGEYEPKCIPEALEGPDNWTARWSPKERPNGKKPKKVGTDALKGADFREIENRQCKKGARQFDAYCHQYNVRDGHPRKTPRYTDYRTEAGDCEFAGDDLSKLVCLGNQCMFEYCLYRRDEWIDECEENSGDLDLPKDEPGWGDVYDYGNMHADLDTNEDTDGDFVSQVCTDYYTFKDAKLDDINDELALAAGEDGEDDEDEDDGDDSDDGY